MKKYMVILSTCIGFLLAMSSASADTIYLKDGTILKGKIIKEDESSVSVEMTDKWNKIDRSNIEMIKKDVPEEAKPLPPAEPVILEPVKQAQSPAPSRPTGDLRIRLGSAPGVTEGELNGSTFPSTAEEGSNFQIDIVSGSYRDSSVGLVLNAGFFVRTHSGYDNDIPPTHIDYEAVGFNLGIGIGIKASEIVHFEGRAEVGLGGGEPIFTPGISPLTTEAGGYTSFTLLAGAYITFNKPGFQIGIEVGTQSFNGDFKIRNSFGQTLDGSVSGNGGIANFVFGYRF